MRRLLLVGLVASFFLAAACGDRQPTPQSSFSSGIRGIVLFAGGPGVRSPSPLPGGFGTTKRGLPYRWVTVRVTRAADGKTKATVASLKPDTNALFTVSLPPGTYVLTPLVPKNGPAPLTTRVVVKPGEYARAIVYVTGP